MKVKELGQANTSQALAKLSDSERLAIGTHLALDVYSVDSRASMKINVDVNLRNQGDHALTGIQTQQTGFTTVKKCVFREKHSDDA